MSIFNKRKSNSCLITQVSKQHSLWRAAVLTTICSEHSLDELVDEVFSVAPSTAILVGVSLGSESLLGWVELEGPEEVVGLLEVGSNSWDFVNEIFNAGDTMLAEYLLNDAVIGERDSGSLDLSVASLVDELSDDTLWRVSISDVGLNSSDHVHGGLVKSDEDTVVELSQSEELENLFAGRVQLVDTKISNVSFNIYIK